MSNSRSSIVLRTERPFLVPVSDDDEEDEEDDAFLVPAVLVAGRTCGVDVARDGVPELSWCWSSKLEGSARSPLVVHPRRGFGFDFGWTPK